MKLDIHGVAVPFGRGAMLEDGAVVAFVPGAFRDDDFTSSGAGVCLKINHGRSIVGTARLTECSDGLHFTGAVTGSEWPAMIARLARLRLVHGASIEWNPDRTESHLDFISGRLVRVITRTRVSDLSLCITTMRPRFDGTSVEAGVERDDPPRRASVRSRRAPQSQIDLQVQAFMRRRCEALEKQVAAQVAALFSSQQGEARETRLNVPFRFDDLMAGL